MGLTIYLDLLVSPQYDISFKYMPAHRIDTTP